MLEQLPRGGQPLELLVRKEVVVDPVPLPRPGRPGGRRHRQVEVRYAIEQVPDQGALAHTGRTGDHEQPAGGQSVGALRRRYLRKWLTSSARWRCDRPPIVLLGEMRHCARILLTLTCPYLGTARSMSETFALR